MKKGGNREEIAQQGNLKIGNIFYTQPIQAPSWLFQLTKFAKRHSICFSLSVMTNNYYHIKALSEQLSQVRKEYADMLRNDKTLYELRDMRVKLKLMENNLKNLILTYPVTQD